MNPVRMLFLYIIQRASLCGVDRYTILNDLKVSCHFIEQSSESLLTEQLPRLMDCILKRVKKDSFGFECGKNMHPSVLGLGGFAATHAPSLGALLKTLKRYIQINSSWYRLSSMSNSKTVRWTLDLSDMCSSEARTQIADAWAATTLAIGRVVLDKNFTADAVLLKRSPPRDLKLYHDYFGEKVFFDSKENRIVFEKDSFHKPSALDDQALFDQLSNIADKMVLQQNTSSSIIEIIRQCIRAGNFELKDVAHTLQMKERTIQRRLKDQNTTFLDLRDEIRLELAEVYLENPVLTVEQIAERLGFSGNRAFRSAYHRWTGRSPRSARKTE